MKTEQQDIEEKLDIIFKAGDWAQIEKGELKDELRVMPGSLLRKIYDAWLSVEVSSDAQNRSSRYLETLLGKGTIPAIGDKLRGHTGVQRKDASALLQCLFTHWRWDNEKCTNLPYADDDTVNERVTVLLDALFSHHKKLLLIKFEGKTILRFYDQNPEKFGITFTSNETGSIVSAQSQAEALLLFNQLVSPYFKPDPEKRKGILAWVFNIDDLTSGDSESYNRFFNMWQIAGFLRSFQICKPEKTEAQEAFMLNTVSTEENVSLHNENVENALKYRLVIIVKGLSAKIRAEIIHKYKERDGLHPPTDDKYSRLVKSCQELHAQHFVLPSPANLWPHEHEIKMFVPPDFEGELKNAVNASNSVFVEPMKDTKTPHLEVQYWCAGYPVSRGRRGRSLTNDQNINAMTMVKMPQASKLHDNAFNMLYLATSYRLGRQLFMPGDGREEMPVIPGDHAIWALREKGFEVIPAHLFLKLINL